MTGIQAQVFYRPSWLTVGLVPPPPPPPPTYSELVLALPNLKQFLKFDEPSGTTAADSSGNGNTGTYEANVLLNQTGPLTGSKAITMDGSEGKVTCTYNPCVNSTIRSFGGYFNRTDQLATHQLFGQSGQNGGLQINGSSDNIAFAPENNGQAWTGGWPGEAQWVFMGLEFDESADTQALYIDGSLVSSIAQTEAWPSPATFTIGARQHAFDRVWKGSLYGWFVVEGSVGATAWADLAAATTP